MQTPNDILIHDELEACPYLPDRVARLPLRVPSSAVSEGDIDARLARGERRTGEFVYVTQCPRCQACQPIRLLINEFRMNATMRKTLRKNNARLRVKQAEVSASANRVDLFNRHRQLRQLGQTSVRIDVDDYAWAFARSCFHSFELTYWLGERLVGVAIMDEGRHSLSAVYTYYDPDYSKLSLGTWSILRQVQLGRDTGKRYLYLGFYIIGCDRMDYKSRFVPHERLIGGAWQRFD